MRMSRQLQCIASACADVKREAFQVPRVNVDPAAIRLILISEAAPEQPRDYYYAGGQPLFEKTTVLAFQEAGAAVTSIADIVRLGVYLTTAVKCGKTGYGLQASTVRACSVLLERELAYFPNVRALLLMGDVAIQAVNAIARRAGEARVIPAGPTYKLRGRPYTFHGWRVFPSYLQAGPSFFIEKSKRRMIAEDIGAALRLVSGGGPSA
jgi:uracil-DNA glycosylase